MRNRSTDPDGRVRVRPTGLVAAPTVKRYQYVVIAARPDTSAWIVWSVAAAVAAVPVATTVPGPKPASEATSQVTSIPLPAATGSIRVHKTTPSADGSPEITPDGNSATGTNARLVA